MDDPFSMIGSAKMDLVNKTNAEQTITECIYIVHIYIYKYTKKSLKEISNGDLFLS